MTQEALKLALEALEKSTDNFPANVQHRKAITAIKEALAQPEQEPVAYTNGTDVILAKYWTADYPPEGWEPLGYITPPQRTWVGLTDEDDIDWEEGGNLKDLVKAIEAKLKEKNT